MTQTDIIVRGFALVGVFYLLRCIAHFVLRVEGYEAKDHRHYYLNVIVALAAMGIGWGFLKIESQTAQRLIAAPEILNPTRDSFLLSDQPVELDLDLERPVDFGINSAEAYSFMHSREPVYLIPDLHSSQVKRIKSVFQPYVHLDFIRSTKPVSIERLKSQQVDVSALEQLWSAFDHQKESASSLDSEHTIWTEVPTDGLDSSLLSGKLPTIEFDAEQPFVFDSYPVYEVGSSKAEQGFNRIGNFSWTITLITDETGGSQEENGTLPSGATDIPGAPRQQIEELMREAPGLYDSIPEVQQLLNR